MAARSTSPLMHPLCGADVATLVRVLADSGGIPAWAAPRVAIALGAAVGRLPFTLAERAWVAAKLRDAGEMPAPVFIIGHWRSGTTHLFNILSKHGFGYVSPLAAGMPWDFMGLVALLRPLLERLLPRERFIDSIPVAPDSPQEDEVPLANMNPLSFYHGIYFPRRFRRHFDRGIFFEGCSDAEVEAWTRRFVYFSRKTWLAAGRKTLLIKNPVYTARIRTVLGIWPDARFVHCVRDPYDVFVSMRNFYDKLFPQFALQGFDHIDVDAVVTDGYARLMDRYIAESPAIPEGQLYECRYERLATSPMEEVAALYETLGLPGYDEAAPVFRRYLDSVRRYERNRYRDSGADRARVEAAWGRYLAHWRYTRPAA